MRQQGNKAQVTSIKVQGAGNNAPAFRQLQDLVP